MAKNVVFETSNQLSVPVPAGTKSGDAVVFGDRGGVALTDQRADGNATVQFNGVWNLSVKGADTSAAGTVAVAPGDVVLFVAADTPKLSKKSTGVRYGIAMGSVAAGATATIPVRLG